MVERLFHIILVLMPALCAGGLGAAPIALPPVSPVLASPPGLVLVWDERVTETLDLPTWALQQARRRMLAGKNISYNDMRALADHGDGLAAFRYANRLMELDRPDLLSAAALYYATAAYTGRDYAIGPLIRLLSRDDIEFSDGRLQHLENALRAFAMRGNEQAAMALSGFYASGSPFGFQPQKLAALQRDLAGAGDANVALDLIMQLMTGKSVEADQGEIESWFATLALSENLGQRATAQNLQRLYDADPTRYAAAPAPDTQEDQP